MKNNIPSPHSLPVSNNLHVSQSVKGAASRCFGECQFVLTIIIYVIKILIKYIHQKHEDKYHTAKVYMRNKIIVCKQ
jgi:hypothetical protein